MIDWVTCPCCGNTEEQEVEGPENAPVQGPPTLEQYLSARLADDIFAPALERQQTILGLAGGLR